MHVRAEYGADFSLSSSGFKIGQLLRGPETLQSIPLEQNPELRQLGSIVDLRRQNQDTIL